ncbi:MAG: ketoacyl-ACP synthase III [Candidatus Sulfotelmatobacter sp.]
MVKARIAEIAYYLPESVLTNQELSKDFPGWTVEDIAQKTGILERRIATSEECASDLALKAAEKLFASGACSPAQIDFILLCTESPDYFLPASACILQQRLGISTAAGALDFNLGCSGFVYGLGLAKGLIETNQAQRVLLITAETYSKFIAHDDRSTRTIFGDGAAATLIEAIQSDSELITAPVYGTDGRGARNLIVERGAMRLAGQPVIKMAGPEVFNFTIARIPRLVEETLTRSQMRADQIDLFVFHQANRYMLDHLRKKLAIPETKFYLFMETCANTVSSSIPIALFEARKAGKLGRGSKVMVVGFGVGYSWAACMLDC